MRTRFFWLLVASSLSAGGAEIKFNFSEFPVDQPPPRFHGVVSGKGKPGDWKVIMDDVPPLLPPLTPQAPAVTRRAVLAQLSQDPTDERFPLLIYDGETFGDFKLTTRFKIINGGLEQMAGIAFRIQNETNFYVVRASCSQVPDWARWAMVIPQRSARKWRVRTNKSWTLTATVHF